MTRKRPPAKRKAAPKKRPAPVALEALVDRGPAAPARRPVFGPTFAKMLTGRARSQDIRESDTYRELEVDRDQLLEALRQARPYVTAIVAGDAAAIGARCDTLALVDAALAGRP